MRPSRPTILITEPEYFTPGSIARMRQVGTVTLKRVSHAELLKIVSAYDALVVRIETKVNAAVVQRASRLECVVTATTGVNHIDREALRKKSIPLFSLHHEHSVPTAEHAVALMMALARNIPWSHRAMIQGDWRRWNYIGTELHGKTLGIYGIGRIGTLVAAYGRGIGMKVIAYDPYVSEAMMRKKRVRKVNFRSLLAQSDILTLHAPLTEMTLQRFGKAEFSSLKNGAMLINTARGLILQDSALLNALRMGLRAALDVYEEEPLAKNHPIRLYAKHHTNLLLTPHLGSSTNEAVGRASNQAADFVVSFFA